MRTHSSSKNCLAFIGKSSCSLRTYSSSGNHYVSLSNRHIYRARSTHGEFCNLWWQMAEFFFVEYSLLRYRIMLITFKMIYSVSRSNTFYAAISSDSHMMQLKQKTMQTTQTSIQSSIHCTVLPLSHSLLDIITSWQERILNSDYTIYTGDT